LARNSVCRNNFHTTYNLNWCKRQGSEKLEVTWLFAFEGCGDCSIWEAFSLFRQTDRQYCPGFILPARFNPICCCNILNFQSTYSVTSSAVLLTSLLTRAMGTEDKTAVKEKGHQAGMTRLDASLTFFIFHLTLNLSETEMRVGGLKSSHSRSCLIGMKLLPALAVTLFLLKF